MVALFYMRTPFFCLSHGFEMFSQIFSLTFLTFIFQVPAWEFYKVRLWALLCSPCSHILFAIHPVRDVGGCLPGKPVLMLFPSPQIFPTPTPW